MGKRRSKSQCREFLHVHVPDYHLPQCTDIDDTDTHGHCRQEYAISIASGGSSLLTQLIVATILQLHREETFQLPSDSPSDTVIEAEVARRTFWVIQGTLRLDP